MSKKKAYSYIRFSNERQIKGNSLERQEELLNNFMRENPDFELVEDSYKDLGVSGYSGQHKTKGSLSQFLLACKQGKIEKGSYLLVESIDRLSRLSGFKANSMIMDLVEYVTIITLEDGSEYSQKSYDNHQIYVLQAKIQQAHSYSDQLSSRLIKARKSTRDKVRAGEIKKITKTCPSWLEWSSEESQFTEVEDRVAIVKHIFEMYVYGGLGTTAIASALNREAVESFNKKGWHGSYIDKILFDRKVIGEMRGRSSEVFENYYPQVIDTELFLLAQQHHKARSKQFRTSSSDNPQPFDIYSGMVFCICGQEAKLQNKGSNRYIYQCKNRTRGLCKDSDGLNKNDLNSHMGRFFDAQLIAIIEKDRNEWVKFEHSNLNQNNKKVLSNKEELVRKKLSNARKLLIGAVDEYEEKEIEHEIAELRKELSDINLALKAYNESEQNLKLGQYVNMSDIGKHRTDWQSFIDGDSKRVLSNVTAININKLQLNSGVRMYLCSGFTSVIASQITGNVLFVLKKKHKSSRGSVSHLANGDMYLNVDDSGAVEFGEGFESSVNLDNNLGSAVPRIEVFLSAKT